MRNQVGNAALAKLDTLDLAELVLCLLSGDAVNSEAALGVVDETEVLASLLNRDDVHETGREGAVGADLAVDLDQTLHDNRLDLLSVKRILETVAEEDDQRQRVAELVRTGGGLRSVGTWKLSVLLFFEIAHLRAMRLRTSSIPDSLSRSQWLGALRRFWCFFGPRPILTVM